MEGPQKKREKKEKPWDRRLPWKRKNEQAFFVRFGNRKNWPR